MIYDTTKTLRTPITLENGHPKVDETRQFCPCVEHAPDPLRLDQTAQRHEDVLDWPTAIDLRASSLSNSGAPSRAPDPLPAMFIDPRGGLRAILILQPFGVSQVWSTMLVRPAFNDDFFPSDGQIDVARGGFCALGGFSIRYTTTIQAARSLRRSPNAAPIPWSEDGDASRHHFEVRTDDATRRIAPNR